MAVTRCCTATTPAVRDVPGPNPVDLPARLIPVVRRGPVPQDADHRVQVADEDRRLACRIAALTCAPSSPLPGDQPGLRGRLAARGGPAAETLPLGCAGVVVRAGSAAGAGRGEDALRAE